MRLQPIVPCRGTYQDAGSVPCLGAPFTRGIWAVGIKKCAVTVPTLRPLGLLEMRESRLCVCPWLGTAPCAPHCSCPGEQGPEELLELLPRQHPAPDVCRGSFSAGSNIPWPSSELCSNPMALLCQLVLFPREQLFLWLMEQHSLLLLQSTCPWPGGRQHKGALWEAQGAGAGTTQLPLQLQSSGKAQGSKHLLL